MVRRRLLQGTRMAMKRKRIKKGKRVKGRVWYKKENDKENIKTGKASMKGKQVAGKASERKGDCLHDIIQLTTK